jgi:hypothetical protein
MTREYITREVVIGANTPALTYQIFARIAEQSAIRKQAKQTRLKRIAKIKRFCKTLMGGIA